MGAFIPGEAGSNFGGFTGKVAGSPEKVVPWFSIIGSGLQPR
jgi:hypothetical protein